MAENYCIFSSVYIPSVEGVGKYTYNLARKLRKEGKNVFIVSDNVFGAPTYEVEDDIKVYRIPCFKFFGGRYPILSRSAEAKGIIDILMKIKFTAVIINDAIYPISKLGIKVGKAGGAKIIAIEHGKKQSGIVFKSAGILTSLVQKISIKSAKKKVDVVFASSVKASEYLKTLGVDADDVLYGRNEEKIGRKSGKKPLSVLVVGDYDAAKTAVSGMNGDYVVSYIGNGTVEGIVNYPTISYTKFSEQVAAADIVYALPVEGLSHTASLAAANGTFIIAQRNSDTEKFLCGGEAGILIENAENELVPAIKKCCDDEYRKAVAKKMQDKFLKLFSSAYAAEKIIKIAE